MTAAKPLHGAVQARGPLSALRTLGAMLVPRTQDINRDVADGIVVQVSALFGQWMMSAHSRAQFSLVATLGIGI